MEGRSVRVATVGGRCSTVPVKVSGEVADPSEADHLYESICAEVRAGAPAVEVDLADVEILTSVGITALLKAKDEASKLGCVVSVIAASPLVRRVFDVTGLTEFLGLE
jgi:anti-anti-sigma factor